MKTKNIAIQANADQSAWALTLYDSKGANMETYIYKPDEHQSPHEVFALLLTDVLDAMGPHQDPKSTEYIYTFSGPGPKLHSTKRKH